MRPPPQPCKRCGEKVIVTTQLTGKELLLDAETVRIFWIDSDSKGNPLATLADEVRHYREHKCGKPDKSTLVTTGDREALYKKMRLSGEGRFAAMNASGLGNFGSKAAVESTGWRLDKKLGIKTKTGWKKDSDEKKKRAAV